METVNTTIMDKNKSSPPNKQSIVALLPKNRQVNGIISNGSPLCLSENADGTKGTCNNRSVPGSPFCGPHGGKLTLRVDGTLGIIGPGCYRAIAQLAQLNHRYVSQVLQGKCNPTSNVLDKIARVVGVEVGWLLDYIKEQRKS